ncbi:hypothetical protein FDP41_011142 [Naegleria fowleri]|uniref:Uncharacterized protein n=1 Tax=Naegleria fowleri TaxID=5763 RepID=A0A6A5C9F8_NAEFO|nr:uncharacterized protein FDP41_011142 [Naegleria fowleri]KAF0983164.1 hypothetical protein FDP41_011142 [Naegleria fowleri]
MIKKVSWVIENAWSYILNLKEMNVVFSEENKTYKVRLAVGTKNDDAVCKKNGFEEYKTVEKLITEVANHASFFFRDNFSVQDVKRITQQICIKAGIPFEEKKLKIVERPANLFHNVPNIAYYDTNNRDNLKKFIATSMVGFGLKSYPKPVRIQFTSTAEFLSKK